MSTHIGIRQLVRNFSTSNRHNFKVTIVGASGRVGQPTALLLKTEPLIKQLALQSARNAKGIAADLSHINTASKVTCHLGSKGLEKAIKGAHLVLLTGGYPRTPGMTRNDLFMKNAQLVKTVAEVIAKVSPDAFLQIITNPINALTPVAGAVFEKLKKGNPQHVFGICSVDLVRAATFAAQLKNMDPSKVHIPCVGGHEATTMIPLFSQATPKLDLTDTEIECLTRKVQNAGTEILKAKDGLGSATLAVAHAARRSAVRLLRGLKGEKNQQECCYVKSTVTKSKYFSTPLQFGKNGIEKNFGIPPNISSYEKKLIEAAVITLSKNVKKGEDFAMT